MAITTDILNTKTVTYKDQVLVAALSAAIAIALAVPFALAVADNNVSANAPKTGAQVASVLGSCDEPATTSSKSTAKKTASTSTTTHVNNSGSTQSGNSGQGNANNTTGGSAAANGNNQSNTGGLVGGVNVIAPVSALNNNDVLNGTLSGNEVNVLTNPLQGATTTTGVLSKIGINV